MKKGLTKFDQVMKDRKRRKRILNRKKNTKKAPESFKWVDMARAVDQKVPKKKGEGFFGKIKSLFKRR